MYFHRHIYNGCQKCFIMLVTKHLFVGLQFRTSPKPDRAHKHFSLALYKYEKVTKQFIRTIKYVHLFNTKNQHKRVLTKNKQNIIINNNSNKPLTLVGIIQMYFIKKKRVKDQNSTDNVSLHGVGVKNDFQDPCSPTRGEGGISVVMNQMSR